MAKKPNRQALGRGLSALLGDANVTVPVRGVSTDAADSDSRAGLMIPIDLIRANAGQPRRVFNESELQDLANSIQEHGVLQPIILRPDPENTERYQIVAGERRWRAAQKAGLHKVPAIVRELQDSEVLELAIIENVQRVDLDPVEEAQGYAQLIESFGHTQEKLAKIIGKSRSHLANMMRLLALPELVLTLLRQGKLSMGHARALINAPDPVGLAKRVVDEGLSVRKTEQLARTVTVPGKTKLRPKTDGKDADTRALEGDLSSSLGMKVSIQHSTSDGGGELRIRYTSLDQLDEICALIAKV